MSKFTQSPRQGYGQMVLDNLVARLREVYIERHYRVQEALKSRRKAEVYRDTVKEKIQRIFKPMPRKTALNQQVLGVTEYRDYRIEKVVYDSRPGFPVTANLYVPQGRKETVFAGVVGSCGHSVDGKASANYQSYGVELAKAGIVTLIFDPIHQGERKHFWDTSKNPNGEEFGPTAGHNRIARWLGLSGDNFGNWRAWDAIRSLDYLLTRPEVDPDRVGMTGNSGGGTMTTWVWPLEDRLRFAAPSCFVTRFLYNLENELPADAEQYPTGVFAEGLEMADFLIARTPDPILLLAQKYCFFDRRGFEETVHEVQGFYRLFGAGDKAKAFMGNNVHGYFPDARHTMVRQFAEWTATPAKKVTLAKPVAEAELLVSKSGNIYKEQGQTFHEIYRPELEKLEKQRKALKPEQTVNTLRKLLTLPKEVDAPFYRILHPYHYIKPAFARYAVETEEGIRAILWKAITEGVHSRTLDVEKKAVIYLPHQSTELEMPSLMQATKVQKATGYYGLDYRGIGQSRYDEVADFFGIYGFEYMANGHHLMFNESYLGKRVWDVLKTVSLLEEEGTKEIELHGVGIGAIVALMATVVDKRIKRVVYENGLLAYGEYKDDPCVEWPTSCILHGSHRHFDLPDLFRVLGKRILIRAPWNTRMQTYSAAALRKVVAEYGITPSQIKNSKSKVLADVDGR